jgi:acyl transferase domain-containing protein
VNSIHRVKGINGINGTNGTNGVNGVNGANGTNGTNGHVHSNGTEVDVAGSTDSNGDVATTESSNGAHINGASINADDEDDYAIIPVSAADEDGPYRQAEALEEFLVALPQKAKTKKFLSDLVYTLTTRRSLLDWCAFSVIKSTSESIHSLKDTLTPANLSISSKRPELSCVFTGQGAQYARMGLGLLSYPVFRDSILSCDIFLKSLGCT